jgi:hypothetical protein
MRRTGAISVERYTPEHKPFWDEFVRRSKNGVFLFFRDYMDYHADRFIDQSLVFFQEERPIALLPANRAGHALVSHGGLTFGGMVSDDRMRTPLMLELFDALQAHLIDAGVSRLVYKAVPHIYHRLPAEEDLYALVRMGATLVRRDVSSAIRLGNRLPFRRLRRRKIREAAEHGLEIRRSDDYDAFMSIVVEALATKYRLTPVHTPEELNLLATRFPEHIELFGAYRGDTMLGGVLMYAGDVVARAQYSFAGPEGKRLGALDLVLDYLINDYYADRQYFDWGISTEQDGRYLNVNLIENKESFGARAIVHDFYELELSP